MAQRLRPDLAPCPSRRMHWPAGSRVPFAQTNGIARTRCGTLRAARSSASSECPHLSGEAGRKEGTNVHELQHHGTLPPPATRRHVPACWAPSCLLLLALAIAGCGLVNTHSAGGDSAATTPDPSGSGSVADQVAPSVVLCGPLPGMLEVSTAVTFEQQTGDTQPMFEVGLGLSREAKSCKPPVTSA